MGQQLPPQGPGFGWGSNGFPPPKKKSKAGWIIVPIVVIGLGLLGVTFLSNVVKHNSDYTQPEPVSTATEAPTYAPTRATAPATRHTTAPQPTKTATTAPEPSDSDLVTKNRIYKTGVQNTVNCRESGARANSATNARKYYNSILACLV